MGGGGEGGEEDGGKALDQSVRCHDRFRVYRASKVSAVKPKLGMFPLTPTVLNRDSRNP